MIVISKRLLAIAGIVFPIALLPCLGLRAQAPTPALQTPAPPGLAEGFASLQSGNAAGAVTILEGVTSREPENVRAWRVLGNAYIRTGQFDLALAAYKRALEIQPGFPAALYNSGVAWARKGDADHAFEWLEKAKATGKLDMTQIVVDGDLESLKSDPRFAALPPTPDDFKNPFVEEAKIIREWDGESAGDQFGWIARSIGDVDGDHVADVVTSAPTRQIDGKPAGRVYVYSSRSGKLFWTADGEPGDQLGNGIEGAGDANHDGVPDVVAGAPSGGKAFVYSGKDGRVLLSLLAEDKQDAFGQHVDGVGDVNHDGYADVMIGAPANNAGGKGAGRAYVYSGKNGKVLLTLTGERAGDAFGSTVGGRSDKKGTLLIVGAPGAGPRKTGRTYVYDGLSQKPRFVIDSDETGQALGAMFVSVVGDVDGDKTPDVYVSDFSNAAKGPSTGRIYVYSGKTGKSLLTLTGEGPGGGFGIGPANAGDVDHDGHSDLVVGAWQFAGAASSGGKVSLFSGKDGHLLNSWTGRINGETFGFDATGIGDVDGDGTIDLLLTSAWSGIHGFHSGRMYIISGGVK